MPDIILIIIYKHKNLFLRLLSTIESFDELFMVTGMKIVGIKYKVKVFVQ